MTKTSQQTTRRVMLWFLFASAIWLTAIGSGQAQVPTNITPTPPPASPFSGDFTLGTQVAPPAGNTTVITGGTQAGKNLFHSFGTFSVGTDAIAEFQNSGALIEANTTPSTITDIFARVTGNTLSEIDGTIRTSGFGNANFWLMNPNGITFGPGARLDIGGSALFTTAGGLIFSDTYDIGGIPFKRSFETDSQFGPLSIANVEQFGFFSPPEPISVIGSTLAVPSGKTLSLVGGDINIVGGTLSATNVRLSSVQGLDNQECDGFCNTYVDINNSLVHSISSSAVTGTILLAQAPGGKDAVLDASPSGTIQINGTNYTGTSATGFNTNLQVIKIQDGTITVGNVPPVQSFLVANLPSTKLIISSPVVTTLSPATTVDIGGTGTLTAKLNHPFTSSVGVQVRSNDTNIATVDSAEVIVPAGQDSAPVQFRGIAPGNTSIRADVNNSFKEAAITVNLPFDSSLVPKELQLVEGNSGTLKVTLTTSSKDPITVTFTSSNKAVLPPPTSVEIPAGETEVTVPYSTTKFGDATVTATLQTGTTVLDTATSGTIQVNQLQLLTLTPNQPAIEEGKSGTLTLTLSDKAPRDITVTFESSSPGDVPKPQQITIAKGQSTATVPVQGVDDGQAIITATYVNDTAAATVLVNLPFDSTLAPTPLTLVEGNGGTLKLTLTTSSPTPITVTFTSSDPAVLKPQASVTIPANQTEVTVPYSTTKFGDATVTATLQTGTTVLDTATSSKITVNALQLVTLSPNLTLKEGANGTLALTLSNPAPRPITVTFQSSNPADVPTPASITIQPGQTTVAVPVTGADDGQAVITARYAGDTAVATVLVNAVLPPLDSGLVPAPTTLVEGTGGTLTVTLNQPAPQAITVTFTSSNPAVVTAPTSVTIPAGQTTVNTPYATLQSGNATVTASLRAGTQVLDTATSSKITVNSLQLVTLSPNLTLQEGANGTLTLTLSNPAPRPITVTFNSSNPADVPAPTAIVIQPGQTTVPVPVRGADDGQAIITASYAGDTAVATVLVDPTVLPPPPPAPTPQPQPTSALASAGGQSATSLAATTKTIKDPPAMQPLPIPPGNQLVIASGRCAAGSKGEFSSFVQRGRDASPAIPGGPLASPPILEHDVPRISGISVQPGRVALQAPDALHLAPGLSPFLARNAGC